MTFNPWSERHWLKRTFFDDDTKLKNTFSYTTTYRVNEWLDQSDIDRYEDLYRTNPRRARIVCDGDWGVAEGLVYDNFEVVEFDWFAKYKETQLKVHGIDYGFTNDPTALVSVVVDLDNKELYIYDEHYEKAMLTDDIYNMLVAKELENVEIKSENEARLIVELQKKGIRKIKPSIKGPNSIMPGIQYVQGFKIYVHPSCEHTIEELNTYTFDQDNEGNWLNKPIDKNNHALDALRYALSDLIFKPTKKASVDKLRNMKGMLRG